MVPLTALHSSYSDQGGHCGASVGRFGAAVFFGAYGCRNCSSASLARQVLAFSTCLFRMHKPIPSVIWCLYMASLSFWLADHNYIVAHHLFAAKASLDEQKNSGPMDSAGSDSLLGSLELMMDKTSSPGKGDSLMVLHDLRRKRDDLSALDLSDRVKSMAARLRADREEQHHGAAKLKTIREMSQEELVSILRRLEDQVDAQHRTCDRTHMDVLRTKCALGKAERAADQAYLQR